MKFQGSYEALQDLVFWTGTYGEWRDLGNHIQYRAETGAILNWWESTGTIVFQGKQPAATDFEKAFLSYQGALAIRVAGREPEPYISFSRK
jgi:hypothetical protein